MNRYTMLRKKLLNIHNFETLLLGVTIVMSQLLVVSNTIVCSQKSCKRQTTYSNNVACVACSQSSCLHKQD